MLPEQVFDSFLTALSLAKPVDDQNFAYYEAIGESLAKDVNRTISEPAVRIWYRTDVDITFSRFCDRMKNELRHGGHQASDAVIGALIVLYLIHPGRNLRPTEVFNETLSKIVSADLVQFFILHHPPYPGFRDFKIGEFSIGELNWKSLRNYSSSAGSDYFVRYKDRLFGRFAIGREMKPVRVIDWNSLSWTYGLATKDQRIRGLWSRGIEAYFASLSTEYFDEFWESLMEVQQLSRICDQVLWALLRRIHGHHSDKTIVEEWTRDLDYLYAALIAGKNVSTDDLRSCGLWVETH